MAKGEIEVPAWVVLDRASGVPLHCQLYDAVRLAILDGRHPAGGRLPSTRTLADELGVSRGTAVAAFRQLIAEGYVEGSVGSGTRVASSLPEESLRARAIPHQGGGPPRRAVLSERGKLLAGTKATVVEDRGEPRAFRPGLPALEEFPFGVWSRLAQRVLRRPPRALLTYGRPEGYGPLRRLIAERLSVTRAVRCEAGQVIVVSGAQQGIELAARVLLDPGDEAWVEDPGYPGTWGALLGAGVRVAPVPVDGEGLRVEVGLRRAPRARMACVTPSHQSPCGYVMSLGRRLELLQWAGRERAWIVEDDYDSEYRYSGRPLASLQGLDTQNRVIYLGTFSKVLFASLRIAYLVVPPDLVDAFAAARALSGRHTPTPDQAILAEFMAEGHFERHLRRTRTLYAERQRVLMEAAEKELGGLLTMRPAEGGMHLVGWLEGGQDDASVSRRAAALGVEAPPLSAFSMEPRRPGGLVLGYAGFGEAEIERGVRRLAAVLRPKA
jgi:GntR family transcriptional regulator/MocR family aminotransferase